MLSFIADHILGLLPERYQKVAKQFIKFAITGTIGAVVDFGTFGILTRIFHWTTTYTLWGTEIIAANNISVLFAVCSNFIINRYWTFQGSEGNATKQGAGYLLLNTFTWAVNQVLVSIFAFHTPFFTQTFGDNRDFAAKVAAIIITLFINFFGSKLLIFRNR